MARKNKVDVSKRAEQAKAENLNQSQGVEIGTIVVLSFRFCSRLQQCGFHYWEGYKSSDSFWFRFCRAYERGFMTMLTTPLTTLTLTPTPTQSSISDSDSDSDSNSFSGSDFVSNSDSDCHSLSYFDFDCDFVSDSHPVSDSDCDSTPWLVRAAKMLESESLCDSSGPVRKDWWVNLRKSLVKRGFVQRYISGH